MTAMREKIYSLAEAVRTVRRLSREIGRKHRIDAVVCISKGGIIAGRYFAEYLGVRRVYSMGIESYSGKRRGRMKIYQELPRGLGRFKGVLVVDDIADSGASLEIAVEHARECGAKKVVTCTLHRKADCPVAPDYCGGVVRENVWVVYGWERLERRAKQKAGGR